jgi:P pilus assembly chaperone PapD
MVLITRRVFMKPRISPLQLSLPLPLPLSLTLSLACLLFAPLPASAAFTIEPALITFFADRGEKTAFVELVHTGGGPAAIQVSVLERLLDIDGALVEYGLLPKSSDFMVHPAQVILYPKERATVQVQYVGKGKITADRAYALFSQEVPVDVAREEGGVSMSVKMLTNYYTVISLEVGKPGRLAFVSSKAIGGGKIEVIAENRGAGRVKMERLGLVVGGKLITDFTGASNSIMPGQTRRFTFDWPQAVTAKDVRFSY